MNVFDIIGPVMIGPSSSHTAGAVRLGLIAARLLREPPRKAEVTLSGSFADTGEGHGTDKALAAGILGMQPHDERIRSSLTLAPQLGLDITFRRENLPGAHPNTARIVLQGAQGGRVELQGASVGGGNILVSLINGLPVSVTGQYNTLLVFHQDKPGTIAAVTEQVALLDINIGSFSLSRTEKGGLAIMTIEVDGAIDPALGGELERLPHIEKVVMIPSIGGEDEC